MSLLDVELGPRSAEDRGLVFCGTARTTLWFQCGILADIQEGPQRRTVSTMNRAFNRKKDKSWMHTPEALAKHYIAYNAKAEEITLTIGQAFDLAYKKFLESGGKDVETRKQIGSLQKRIQELETENSELKKQLQELEEQLMIAHVPPAGSISMKPQSTDIFDMVPFSPVTPLVPTPASNGCPPPPPTTLPPDISKDLFGAEPFDPFTCGAADFPPDIQSKLDEMQEGFKMGLTLEGTVFSLDPLDSRC
ncbi:PTB domain-containing engulfment adapter protein 1-like [Neolamprologus brichardi]|uniref:PTB domain-containing engulfment adapter protein 1-like n=1 Tax=Neolamprologus brichardi TaxID=32507 RepID=UPI00164399EF|nr:PTB domain-containing engulfment adapter protein 1-like [Neolamprologus brichardi]